MPDCLDVNTYHQCADHSRQCSLSNDISILPPIVELHSVLHHPINDDGGYGISCIGADHDRDSRC
jgi:hypothetical protein